MNPQTVETDVAKALNAAIGTAVARYIFNRPELPASALYCVECGGYPESLTGDERCPECGSHKIVEADATDAPEEL